MRSKANALCLATGIFIVLVGAGCGGYKVTLTPLREPLTAATLTPTAPPSLTPSSAVASRPTPSAALPQTTIWADRWTPTREPVTAEPSLTPWPTPTLLPSSWVTYTNPDLRVTFRYPGQWRAQAATRYSGEDGFWELALAPHTASQFDSLGAVCSLEANRGKPAAYGLYPLIDDWTSGSGQWDGCVVSPSAGLPPGGQGRATLFLRYPEALKPDMLLVLRADLQHFGGILSTLRLTGEMVGTPTPSSGIYDAPACHTPPPGPLTPAPRAVPSDLELQTYAIASAGCNPSDQFDGFQAALPTEAIAALHRWQAESATRQFAEANAVLAPFGYRLVTHGMPYPDYDVFQGATRVVTDVTQYGPLTVNQTSDDFALGLQDSNHGAQAAVLVRRGSVETYDWTVAYARPFNTVYLGNDLLSLSYDAAHSPPGRGISQLNVLRNGQVIYTLAVPHIGAGGGPVRGLTVWGPHWVLEVDGVVVIDGEIINDALGYEEIFAWHLINGKPFYFFRQGQTVGMSYAGQVLPWRYDDVIHGFLCCDPALYNIQSSGLGVWFYARVNGVWNFVGLTSRT